MKKLIVLGIIATMVMGLAVAASAQIDATWAVQLRAYNGAATPNATGTLTVGTRVGASDGWSTAGAEDSAYPAYTGVPGVILSTLLPADQRVNKDQRAPLGENETKVWDLVMFCVGGAPQTMRLDGWLPATATLQEGGNLRVWLQDSQGNVLWEVPYNTSGAQGTPTFSKTFAYDGTPINLQLVASTVAPVEVPEPGSMLAMFSGLVGLVGFGIRRRK